MAAYDHESIAVADTAVGLTAAKIALAASRFNLPLKKVVVTVETAPIRVTWDGTTPTSSVGHTLNIGDLIELDASDAQKFRAIRVSASGNIRATYEV